MHFKSIDSSAVVELHKLTDYNSGHCVKEQIHFRFLGKIFELPAYLMWEFKYFLSSFHFYFHSLLTSTADVLQWEVGANVRLRPHGFPTFLLFLTLLRTTLLLCLWAPPYWASKLLLSFIKPLALRLGSAVTTLQPPPMMEKVGPHR